MSEGQQLISISEMSYKMGVSVTTIKRWYQWWESPMERPNLKHEPPAYERMGGRRTRMFRACDIKALKLFQKHLPRGAMSEFNAAYNWGKRGARALDKKGTSPEDIKKIVRNTTTQF